MCLYQIRKINPEKNLICYKVCYRENNKYYSIYRNYEYKLKETIQIDLEKPTIYKAKENQPDSFEVINEGALHTFVNFQDAIIVASYFKFLKKDIVILECNIPIESKYIYIGLFTTGSSRITDKNTFASYASQQLYIDSVIKSYNHETQ